MTGMVSGGDGTHLSDIEAVLGRHPRVRACAVAREAGGDGSVVAYLVTDEVRVPTVRELATHLARSLPAHAVPAKWVYVDRFPPGAGAGH